MPEIIHHGHRIMLTDGLMFLVTGPQFEDEKYDHARTFDSVSQAKKAIDGRVAAAQKQAVITHRVSIPMLDEMGKPIAVRGVNRADSGVLGYSSPDLQWASLISLPEMFPSVPWIERALAARVDALKRAAALTDQVEKYGIRASRGY